MIPAVVLFCAVGVDPIVCTKDIAVEWTIVPAVGVIECMREGQAAIAGVHPIMGPVYEKVLCRAR